MAWLQNTRAILWRALVKYNETDGEQRAASFAYYAFFALFPLVVLLLTLSSVVFTTGKEPTIVAQKVIGQLQLILPDLPEVQSGLISALEEVWKKRTSAGALAFGVLIWSALRFFQSLVHGVNRAWGTKDFSWWRLPIRNLLMVAILASALFFGTVLPVVLDQIVAFYEDNAGALGVDFFFIRPLFQFGRWLIPAGVLFYGFSMFYKFAPRRKTAFSEVWRAALFVTVILNALQFGFSFYARNLTSVNAIYGTFGGVMLLLLWIYLSGSLVIFGGCLCAAGHEVRFHLANQSERERDDA